MNVNDMHPGKYLKADTMPKPILVTIDKIKREEMSDGKDKWVMYFREIKEGLVLNVTNSSTLAEFFGPETDDWERQKIVVFPTRVQFGKDMVPGLRVRLPKNQPAPPVPAPGASVSSRRTPPPMTQEEVDEPDMDPDDDLPF